MGSGVPVVSDAELDVLKVLWEHGPATVRQVEGQLRRRKRRWAYNTILTLLSRLRDKGCVSSDKGAAAHVFSAAVSRQQLLQHGLCDLADRICDGTASPLVHALVQTGNLSAADLSQLRKLLDELDAKE
jgi:BlaI family transcriptional regulator, penicillinase repressor